MKRSEAVFYRKVIEQSVQSLADDVALSAVNLYPAWTVGVTYPARMKVRKGGKLWRCVQAHTSLAGWEPENAVSLWEQINETHAGTINDPVPYEGNMVLRADLHYLQDGVIYRCTRDTVNPVFSALAELVGLYVEEA